MGEILLQFLDIIHDHQGFRHQSKWKYSLGINIQWCLFGCHWSFIPFPFCVLSCLGNVLVQVKTKLWIFVNFSLPKLRKIPDFNVHLKIHFVILQLPWDAYVSRPAQAILFWFGWCFKCWLNLCFVLVASVEFWKARIPVWCPCKSCLRGDGCAATVGLSCGSGQGTF